MDLLIDEGAEAKLFAGYILTPDVCERSYD